MYNIVVTAAFVEPTYRYHHFIVPLRILIAGYGLIVVLRLLRLMSPWNSWLANPSLMRTFAAVREQDGVGRLIMRRPEASLAATAVIIAALFAAWAAFMIAHTGR
jgi:hypothetical protein